MNDLVSSGASAVTDPEAALMVTNAIKSIIGGDNQEGDTGSVGLEVTTKAVHATEVKLLRENIIDDVTNILLSWWLMLSLVWRSPLLMISSRPYSRWRRRLDPS